MNFSTFYNNQVSMFQDFSNFVNELSTSMGLDCLIAPVKSFERSLEKVENDYNGDFTQLKDILRCTIVLKNGNDANALLKRLSNEFDVVKAWIDFGDTKTGYQGANFVVIWNGVCVEIQANTAINLAAKDGYMYKNPIIDAACVLIEKIGLVAGMGHKYYEILRKGDDSILETSRNYYNTCRMAH